VHGGIAGPKRVSPKRGSWNYVTIGMLEIDPKFEFPAGGAIPWRLVDKVELPLRPGSTASP